MRGLNCYNDKYWIFLFLLFVIISQNVPMGRFQLLKIAHKFAGLQASPGESFVEKKVVL